MRLEAALSSHPAAEESAQLIFGSFESSSSLAAKTTSRAIDIKYEHRKRRPIRTRFTTFAALSGAFERFRDRFCPPQLEHARIEIERIAVPANLCGPSGASLPTRRPFAARG